MTDRLNTLTVVLEAPTRTDDVAAIMEAISMIRGVQQVKPGEVDGFYGTREQERQRLRERIWAALEAKGAP